MTAPWNFQRRELSNGNLFGEMLAWRRYSFQSPQTSSQYEASQLPFLHGYPHWLDPLVVFLSLSLWKLFRHYWIIPLFCFLCFWLKNCSFTNWVSFWYGLVGDGYLLNWSLCDWVSGTFITWGCIFWLFFSFFWVDGGRSIKRAYDALLLDAGGTLLQLAKPVGETYATIGSKYG